MSTTTTTISGSQLSNKDLAPINLSPRQISFRTGGLITAVIGIVSFPWRLYEDAGAYFFTWLVGYGSLLAAFLAVMLVDYWLLRCARLNVEQPYRYGVLVAFGLAAVSYVALARLPAPAPATAEG